NSGVGSAWLYGTRPPSTASYDSPPPAFGSNRFDPTDSAAPASSRRFPSAFLGIVVQPPGDRTFALHCRRLMRSAMIVQVCGGGSGGTCLCPDSCLPKLPMP